MNRYSKWTPLRRRTVLRGLGTTIALPWLDAMSPVCVKAASPNAPQRAVFLDAGLGIHMPFFLPAQVGSDYEPTPYLKLIQDFRNDFTVVSGLSHKDQFGADGHASHSTWLTAARHPGKPGFKNSLSIDQLIAERIGSQTRFPSLVLSGSTLSLSWTAGGVQIPAERSPAKLFQQLFMEGSAQQLADQREQLQRGRSVLDTVLGEADKLQRRIGPRDREKLDEYFTAVRELETSLTLGEEWTHKPKPKVDAQPPKELPGNDTIGRTKQMYELIALALQTDSSRVVTFNTASGGTPPITGVADEWHNLSHHGKDPTKIEQLKLIEVEQFHALRHFFGKLKDFREQGRPLLDTTTVLFGSNLGNASAHSTDNLPILLAGGGFKHGRHIAHDATNNAPLCNLFVAVAQKTGIEVDRFAQSTSSGIVDLT